MRYLHLLLLFFFSLPCSASDLFLTPFHGKSGGTADTWILIRDARTSLADFSFVLSFDSSILDYERILETPNTSWGWQITREDLSAKNGKNRVRLSFKAEHTDRALAKDRDYLLCRLRFAVHKNRSTSLGLEEPDGDMRNWQTAGADFFHTAQTGVPEEEEEENTTHISCFLRSLIPGT